MRTRIASAQRGSWGGRELEGRGEEEEMSDGVGCVAGIECLPDELWGYILKAGGGLGYKDLSSFAIVSKRAARICAQDSVWESLVRKDFPEPAVPADSPVVGGVRSSLARTAASGRLSLDQRSVYKLKFQKVKAKQNAAQRRQMLRVTSTLHGLVKDCQELRKRLKLEREKFAAAQRELNDLNRIRSTAMMQIWEAHANNTPNDRVTEQWPVNIPARMNALDMELRVCAKSIHCIENTLKSNRSMIKGNQNALRVLSYNPTRHTQESEEV